MSSRAQLEFFRADERVDQIGKNADGHERAQAIVKHRCSPYRCSQNCVYPSIARKKTRPATIKTTSIMVRSLQSVWARLSRGSWSVNAHRRQHELDHDRERQRHTDRQRDFEKDVAATRYLAWRPMPTLFVGELHRRQLYPSQQMLECHPPFAVLRTQRIVQNSAWKMAASTV